MQRGRRLLSRAGLFAVVYLLFRIAHLGNIVPSGVPLSVGETRIIPAADDTLRILALGDINLGRSVGQEILKGDTLYPFRYVCDTLARYDIVFANLESALSDQGGETQNPKYNLVFTGPPAGAWSLRRGGVTVVSTANNHMLDYGPRALRETAKNLHEAGIPFAGIEREKGGLYLPAIVTKKEMRCAFFAVTDIMNATGQSWRAFVAEADTGKLLPALRRARKSADVLIVSFHGGSEYAPAPTERVRRFAEAVIDAGADLFLGHHPHVTYGIQRRRGRLIVHSLGNFVFYQPQHYWTGRSYAVAVSITKNGGKASIRSVRYLPVAAGFQPRFIDTGEDADRIRKRTEELSWSEE